MDHQPGRNDKREGMVNNSCPPASPHVRSSKMSYRKTMLMSSSGFSALSPDFQHLLVYNLKDGMDIYEFGNSVPWRSFKQTPDAHRNYPMMTSFLNGGKSVLCGSQGGDVRIWDTASGIHQQTLSHNGV